MMNVVSVGVLWAEGTEEYCVKSVRDGFIQSARKYLRTYKVLKKESNLHWYCIGCDKSVAKIFETLTKVQVRVEAVETQLETVNENVEQMGLRIQELEEKLDHTEIVEVVKESINDEIENCLLYTSPSPRD